MIGKEDSTITLGVLNTIEKNSQVTQRDMAKNIGIALGLTNTYLKRCVKKGLIKVQQAPANRYAYYLTPSGFAEKSRLTAEYFSQGFQFFRTAKREYTDFLTYCDNYGWKRIVLHGLTDLAEVAVLAAQGRGLDIVGIVDSSSPHDSYNGIRVYSSTHQIAEFDAIFITDIGDPQASYNQLIESIPSERIFTLEMQQVLEGTAASGETT